MPFLNWKSLFGVNLANVGGDSEVFKAQLANSDFQLRTLRQGAGISLTQMSNHVEVSTATLPVQEIFIPWSNLEACIVDGIPDQPSIAFPQFGLGGALPTGSPYPAPAWQLQAGALVGVGGFLPLFNKVAGASALVVKSASVHWYGDIADATGLLAAPLHLLAGVIADAGPLDTAANTDNVVNLVGITNANYGHITDAAAWVDVSGIGNIEMPFAIFRDVGDPPDTYTGNIFIRGISFHLASV